MISNKSYWLTVDDKVVEAGDPAAAFLLVSAGSEIGADLVKKYGLEIPAEIAPNPDSVVAPQTVRDVQIHMEAIVDTRLRELTAPLEARIADLETEIANLKAVQAPPDTKTGEAEKTASTEGQTATATPAKEAPTTKETKAAADKAVQAPPDTK